MATQPNTVAVDFSDFDFSDMDDLPGIQSDIDLTVYDLETTIKEDVNISLEW